MECHTWGRLFSSRFFFGSFIQNKKINNSYFNFNLNKPNDYLFKYAYFGRSETEGLFSQQFILNEGGFKSIIPNSSSNQWILSSNFSIGIWKWVEGYLDFGILKNVNQRMKFYNGYGVRLNFIPDYLELYFPVGSSHEYSIVKENYLSKIRFVLSSNKYFCIFFYYSLLNRLVINFVFLQSIYMSKSTLNLNNNINYLQYKKLVIEDYKTLVLSRECSIIGRREVFLGKGKFGIFGDGKELPQMALNHFFKDEDFRSGYYRDQTFMMAIGKLTKLFFCFIRPH